jgi:hypothetical protein
MFAIVGRMYHNSENRFGTVVISRTGAAVIGIENITN